MEKLVPVLSLVAAVYLAAGIIVPLVLAARRKREGGEPGPTAILLHVTNPVVWVLALVLWPVLLALEFAERRQDSEERRRMRADAERRKARAARQAEDEAALLDKTGRTCSAMRPGGEILVDGRRVQARAASGVIDPGTSVRVRAFERGVAVVEEPR